MTPDSKQIRTDVNRGIAWIGMAASFVSVLDIVANVIILAVWVSPAEYGVAALVISLFPALDLAADMGLSAAVIQRDDHSDAKLSTVFWLGLLMSVALLAILAFIVGPILSAVHGHPILALMLTAYGAKLVWENVYQLPRSLMRRELRFKEIAGVRSIANLAEFGGKVGAAAAGAGIWCFVVGPLVRELAWGIGIQWCHPWRPRFVLRIREAGEWVWFGLKTSASQVLFHFYSNLDYQVVGHFFGEVANGYYRLAYDIVLEPCRILGQIVNQVAFPAYARLKARRTELIEQFLSFTRLNLVVVLGFVALVLVAVPDIIEVLYNRDDFDWSPAAAPARILCAVGILRALSALIPPLLEGMGYPGRSLAYNAVAAVVLPASFVIAAVTLGDSIGYLSVAIAWAVGYPIAFGVLAALALGVLELRAGEYLRRIVGIPACAAGALGVGVIAQWLGGSLPTGARVGITTAAVVGTFFFALDRFQGLGFRSVARSLKGDGKGES